MLIILKNKPLLTDLLSPLIDSNTITNNSSANIANITAANDRLT